MHSTAVFTNVIDLAKFCAELLKQGVVFRAKAWDDVSWVVEMTGY